MRKDICMRYRRNDVYCPGQKSGVMRMTALRHFIIEELERVPEDKLHIIMQFIGTLTDETGGEKKRYNLEQFVMPPTERGQDADAYVRELRNNDRL